jgi:hypothetical protein
VYAVVGRVRIKPGHEDETRSMIAAHGVPMVQAIAGFERAYWGRTVDGGDVIQHSFWVFDTEEHARVAEATFNTLREMPEAPAEFVGVDVCEVLGDA